MRQQEPTRALKVFPLGSRQMFLHFLADIVHRPSTVANHVEAVYDDLGVGKEGSGDIAETFIHVHDGVLDLIAVGKGLQILLNTGHLPIGEDVKNALCQGIGEDALEFFTTNVSLELINRNSEGEAFRARRRHVFEAARDAADRGASQGGDVLCAVAPAQQVHDLQRYLMREALIPSREATRLRKAFPAFRAHVSPSGVTQE